MGTSRRLVDGAVTLPFGSQHGSRTDICRHTTDALGDVNGQTLGYRETVSAERVIIFGLALMRAATLLLGAVQLVGGAPSENTGLAVAAFAAAGATSLTVFVRAALRIRRRSTVLPLDATAALAETIAGFAGLLLLRAATPVDVLLGPDFWMLPYTVITAILLAAGCRRVLSGLAGSLALTVGYLAAVSPALRLGSAVDRGAVAAALDNAFSYPGFYVLGAIMFYLYRFVTGEVDLLRRRAARSSAERARLQAARAAYRLGHDYPKAYLRELRRAERPATELRRWATRFRSDLLAALSLDPRIEVDLAEELASVTATFADAMPVRLDTQGLTDELHGVPVLIVAQAVRECLNNVSHHCYGSAAAATATCADGTLTVTVEDDGPGCNPDQVMAAWALKQNAVHLVEAAGGGYTVESRPKGGTTVRLTYPLNGQGQAIAVTARHDTRPAQQPGLLLSQQVTAIAAVTRRPPPGTRQTRRWRFLLTMVATFSFVMLVALGAVSWHIAFRLVQVKPVTDIYPLRVVAVDTRAAQVKLSRGLDADEPGSFRLSWPAGHATAGPVIAEDATSVTRSLTNISGSLRQGQWVGIQPNAYTGDPGSALGLPYADVTVSGPTGALPAWYIAGRRRTWVLLIHGLDGSRTDTLPAMPTLNTLGFPMLALTYRNDTGAAPSSDHHSHLGDTEWHDIEAAIGYAQAHGAQGVVLYGWSLGGGMAIVASEQSPERNTVRALVLDSPLLDWPATLSATSKGHGVPPIVTRATRTMLALSEGVNLNRYSETRLAAALSTPTLLVQGSADLIVPPAEADALARVRPDLVIYLRVAGANHVSAVDTDPSGFSSALSDFLGPLP